MSDVILKNLEEEVKDSQVIEQKKPVEYKLIGSQRHVKGHNLYEINTKTGDIRLVDVKRDVSVDLKGKPSLKTTVKVKKDCVYIQALNLVNVKKRFVKMVNFAMKKNSSDGKM